MVRHDRLNKVAEITLAFWIAKIIATTLGETAGDFLAQTLGLGYVVGFGVTVALLIGVLSLQIRSDRHVPVLFWAAIVATTTAGTEVSDMLDRTFGVGYVAGSALLLAGLLATLGLWGGLKWSSQHGLGGVLRWRVGGVRIGLCGAS